jgi:hypothetical protein
VGLRWTLRPTSAILAGMQRFLILAVLAGCVPTTYSFTPSSSRPISPKPENCAFEVMTSEPTNPYDEVGVLELYNGDAPKDADKFRKLIAKQVCEVGGDVVMPTIDDKGRYTKGTILHYRQPLNAPVGGPHAGTAQ